MFVSRLFIDVLLGIPVGGFVLLSLDCLFLGLGFSDLRDLVWFCLCLWVCCCAEFCGRACECCYLCFVDLWVFDGDLGFGVWRG